MYDPVTYWKQAGKTYYQDFKYNDEYIKQEEALIKYLEEIEFNSVLELGCGFGRITQLFAMMYIEDYTGVDVSTEQLNHAKEFSQYKFIESDILPLQLDRKFDLVIAVEVLMHQTPDKIQSIIDKMKSLSKKHVIDVDYYANEGVWLEPHNFKHDYYGLYGDNLHNVRVINNKQRIFHYEI